MKIDCNLRIKIPKTLAEALNWDSGDDLVVKIRGEHILLINQDKTIKEKTEEEVDDGKKKTIFG